MGRLNLLSGLVIVALPSPPASLSLLALHLAVKAAQRLRSPRRAALPAATAPRRQGPEPTTLEWDQLSCCLVSKAGNVERALLCGLQGRARPGRLLAIMGSSGAGKTTLLNALAGQVARSKKLRLSGRILVNGCLQSEMASCTAYVRQDEIFYSQVTVRETLELAAALCLPKTLSVDERLQEVDKVLSRLGLQKCADSIVGDTKKPVISGGEKKRLAIACELLRNPSLIFVDEPTSGLDASQAQAVMNTLHQLAKEGHTIVCSIHQPRSSIFTLFDDLILLSTGQVVYSGPADDALNYFKELGYPCPDHYNPAEHIADLIADDLSGENAAKESVADRVQNLLKEQGTLRSAAPFIFEAVWTPPHSALSDANRAGVGLQFRLLFKRAWRQVIRDTKNLKIRMASAMQAATVFGFIWWRLGLKQSTVQSRLGLLQILSTYIAQTTLFKTLYVFPIEKTIMTRERTRQSYQVGPFFLSKLLAEIPVAGGFPILVAAVVYPMAGLQLKPARIVKMLCISSFTSLASGSLGLAIGAVSPSIDSALVIGPAVMLVFLVFGGLYTNDDDVPLVLRWIPKASTINRGYEGMCCNEFPGLEFEDEGPGSLLTGQQVLSRIGYGSSSVFTASRGLLKILFFQYWLTYNILQGQSPKYQPLLAPDEMVVIKPLY